MRRHLAWGLLVACLACSDDRLPDPPASFVRPNRAAFVCVERQENNEKRVVPLLECDTGNSRFALHALVTQSSRGEVGAVDLSTGRILDSRVDIPGFTFVAVGELPSAIVVPAEDPTYTYVANFGSRDVYVVRTDALLALSVENDPVVQRVELSVGSGETLRAGAPIDMVLSPAEDALLVAVTELGAVLRLPLETCEDAEAECPRGQVLAVEEYSLAPSRDLLRTTLPAPERGEGYQLLCDFERPALPDALPIEVDDEAMMTAPRPVALALDAFCKPGECTRRLLVADDALPIIHALDLDVLDAGGDSPVLEPIYVATPTTDVVVTPPVPTSLAEGAPDTQFVYAVDANDGSVLAAEGGRVIDVNPDPEARPDRLPLGATSGATPSAVVLEVATPAFDVMGGGDQFVEPTPTVLPDGGVATLPELDETQCLDSEHPEQQPRRLRGVFLAAALTDGSVRLIDVHDMELRGCRTCPTRVTAPIPQVVRHHPRLAATFQVDEDSDPAGIEPRATDLEFVVDFFRHPVRADGTTSTPAAPGLECIACAQGMSTAFPRQDDVVTEEDDAGVSFEVGCPEETPAILCSVVDPWMAGVQGLIATYEGRIPGTRGGRGRLRLPGDADNVSGEVELVGEVDFCAAGVLGLLEMPALPDGSGTARGDQLVVRSLVSDSRDETEECKELADALDEADAPPLGFEIIRAYEDRLLLRPRSDARFDDVGRIDMSLVRTCTAESLLTYEVRSLDSYLIQIGDGRAPHRVVRGADGLCIPAAGAPPGAGSRAYAGVTYDNGSAAFQLRAAEEDEALQEPEPGVQLRFVLQSPAFPPLVFDATAASFRRLPVVPVQLLYEDIARRLYLVDIHQRGLVPISLEQFPPTGTTQFD